MPSTKEIRRRIKSIKSTRQITKAMEMVSAAKMRKAQMQTLATRAYAKYAWELVQNLTSKSDPKLHRLLRKPEQTNRVLVIVMSSNRGLIGGFNNNIVQTAASYAKQFSNVDFITLGKKGRESIKKLSLSAQGGPASGWNIVADFEKKDMASGVLDINSVAKLAVDDFIAGKYDKVILVYMDFVSTLVQKPHTLELLPLGMEDETLGNIHPHPFSPLKPTPKPSTVPGVPGEGEENAGKSGIIPSPQGGGLGRGDYLFEPTVDIVLEHVLPKLTTMQIYQALLETNAAEHSARMVAMKNATDAAGDLVSELTLEYNQLRQSKITTELSEITAGRIALE
ncbi:MAG: ATP synthase F1 subunit gamma [Candidatus Doudnabacteria bacterium RIFCSPHIGHO2_01_FULL_46_14]|uniref:ATP synthase gamma chain n=1 Tax=Candidatus Doudnabacteria bacterium RIFCSPHIGHO2_01_FULL_46_14 TaxID=1817824 RepID=A0A1F5NNR2_9BACT|nr:MAG: ATP synthase F1 subunit gamma [Candidatus Doudnabacteria bacterium RIFCSPHIGHO2_01_FULL_46_14]HLB58709.1 ATP synthase F1 subunit gamma [Bdellovibrionota bacterium]